jgi:glycosyltransferase involved in cell wall biosynthesis
MALLSIVIPIHAFDERHQDCHRIISASLDQSCEVILVVDNPSIQTQVLIASNFSQIVDPGFAIICGDFGGPGAARNEGLRSSKSEWITFWDSDDFAFPSRIVQDIESYGRQCSVLVGSYSTERQNVEFREWKTENGDGARVGPCMKNLARNLGLWRMVFRRARIANVKFPEISMAEDKVFFASLYIEESEIYKSDNEYYRYRIGSPKSLTRSKNSISELPLAISLLLSPEFDKSVYSKELVKRLALTSIKRGNFRTRTIGILTLIKLIKA